MTGRDQRLMLGAAIGTSALLLVAALIGHPELLAYAAPVFLLAVPLLAGRYVGEERLARLRDRVVRTRRRPLSAARPASRRPAALLPRGGRLIAAALAVRPPPAPLAS